MASDVSFGPDPNAVITPAVALARASLAAAAATPTLKRFVQTSSSSAAPYETSPPPDAVYPDEYNTRAVEQALAPPPYGPDRIIAVYAASKVLQEKEVWKFVAEQKPHFVANTVLPDFVNGRILHVDKQGFPSSLAILKAIWDGDLEKASFLPPQYEIDAEDTGMLHVAAMCKSRVFLLLFHELSPKSFPGKDLPHPSSATRI